MPWKPHPTDLNRLVYVSRKYDLPQPEQKHMAIHQFRSPHSSDWYDGIPDHHDGHGPYEVRTLYTTLPQRPWAKLIQGVRVDGDTVIVKVKGGNDAARDLCGALIEEINK